MIRPLVDRLLESSLVYRAWQAPFADQKFRPVRRFIDARPPARVLDIGCGPGTNARHFLGSDYVGVDINEDYLALARRRYSATFVCADLAADRLPVLGRFDLVLVNSVLHHLADDAAERVLHQAAQCLTDDGSAHVLELVMPDASSPARLMARLDRGRFARSLTAWQELLARRLNTVVFEPYSFGGGLWSMVYFQGRAKR
jgi:SAM-dependent methyltransferase